MKKFLSISLTFLLAFVITYAGSGVNAYSFCCDDCNAYGVEAIITNKCCDIHHDIHPSDKDIIDNADTCESSHDQCTLERLDIDLQSISFEENLSQLSIKVLEILFPLLPYLPDNQTECNKSTDFITHTQKPPNMSKRVYFSLLETLII